MFPTKEELIKSFDDLDKSYLPLTYKILKIIKALSEDLNIQNNLSSEEIMWKNISKKMGIPYVPP